MTSHEPVNAHSGAQVVKCVKTDIASVKHVCYFPGEIPSARKNDVSFFQFFLQPIAEAEALIGGLL